MSKPLDLLVKLEFVHRTHKRYLNPTSRNIEMTFDYVDDMTPRQHFDIFMKEWKDRGWYQESSGEMILWHNTDYMKQTYVERKEEN